MFDRLSEIFGAVFVAETADKKTDFKTALAALLVHACRIDGERQNTENLQLRQLLQKRFQLSDFETEWLVAEAEKHEDDAVDLYRYTSTIAEELDQSGRSDVVRMLWEIVLVDGNLDDYESNLVWRVAELLGVSTRDRVNLRQQVEVKLGLSDSNSEKEEL